MKASEIMTPNPISVEPTVSVMGAVRLMLQHRVTALPVVAGSGTLVGIITEADLLSRAEAGRRGDGCPRWLEFLIGPGPLAPQYAQACKSKVHEVMSRQVFTASEDTTVENLVQIMEQRRVKRLPILRGGKLVCIVSRVDVIRAMAHMVRANNRANAEPRDINPEWILSAPMEMIK